MEPVEGGGTREAVDFGDGIMEIGGVVDVVELGLVWVRGEVPS